MSAKTFAERRSAVQSQTRRELPVLFHLLDVARPPAAVGPSASQSASLTVSEPASQADELAPAANTEAIAKELNETKPDEGLSLLSARRLDSQSIRVPPEAPLSGLGSDSAPAPRTEPASEPLDESPVAAELAVDGAAADAVLAATIEPQAESKPAQRPLPLPAAKKPSITPPTPRSRFEHHRQRLLQLSGDEWVATHGKYIAIGFVLALLGTIYLARVNRPAPVAEQPGASPSADNTELAVSVPPTKLPIHKDSAAVTAAAATAAAATGNDSATSPAQLPERNDSRAQVSLHPPTIPQLPASSPAGSTAAKTDENLFPWASTDPRVASRPASPEPIHNQEPRPPAPGDWPSAGQVAPPTATPAYPNTGYPAQLPPSSAAAHSQPLYSGATTVPAYSPGMDAPGRPGAAYAPPSHVPGSAYGSGGVYAPSNAAAPGSAYGPGTASIPGSAYGPPPQQPQAQPYAPPPSLPPDTSARGIRYERTGSGLY